MNYKKQTLVSLILTAMLAIGPFVASAQIDTSSSTPTFNPSTTNTNTNNAGSSTQQTNQPVGNFDMLQPPANTFTASIPEQDFTSTTSTATSSSDNLMLVSSHVSNSDIQTGQSTTISATIENQNVDLSNVIVEMTIFDQSNKLRLPTTWSNQTLSANQPMTFTATSSTNLAASHYHVWLSVYNSDRTQTLATFTNVGTFTVEDATTTGTTTPPMGSGFQLSASAAPTTVSLGSPVTINSMFNNMGQDIPSGLADVEVYNSSNNKVFQQSFNSQNFVNNNIVNLSTSWTPTAADTYTIKLGAFSNDWSQNYGWNNAAATFTVGSNGNGTGTSTNSMIDLWWPTDGAHLSGVQPLKALLENTSTDQYNMFWQVDNGQWNYMYTSTQDYPHKEAYVDFSGWNWQPSGNYTLNFIAQDMSGNNLTQKSINVVVNK